MVKEKKEELLVPLDDYMKAGIQLGTGVITAYMKKFIFRRRSDGLAIINSEGIDKRLRAAASILSQYNPEDIIIVCKREGGWKAVEMFGKLTGAKTFTKKYPAGIITNSNLSGFFEPSLLLVIDPWLDKAPIFDALKLNIPIIALCDSNNITANVDLIVPCNNKSNKSLGLVFWILAREYLKNKGISAEMPSINEFTGE